MILNWLTAKAQQFLPEQNVGLDEHELSISFDFTMNAEIMDLKYAQNATATTRFALDEHELALA